MQKAAKKLLFVDSRSKDLTAKGRFLYVLGGVVFFAPTLLGVYSYLFPKVGNGFGFIIAWVLSAWLMLPLREWLYTRYTFTAEAAEMERRANVFKDLAKKK